MPRTKWPLLGVIVLFTGLAGGETLDEAIRRMAEGAKAVRDLTVRYETKIDESVPGDFLFKGSGVTELQTAREGNLRLFRILSRSTITTTPTGGIARRSERHESSTRVIDGKFDWLETRSGQPVRVSVVKLPMPDGPGMGAGLFIIGPGDPCVLAADPEALFQAIRMEGTARMTGKGTVAGRPTTQIKVTYRTGRPSDADAAFLDLDDATGTVLAFKSLRPQGSTLYSQTATRFEVNTGLDRKLFTYSPPPEVKIRDQTPGAKPRDGGLKKTPPTE